MADGLKIGSAPHIVDLLIAEQRVKVEHANAARASSWRAWLEAGKAVRVEEERLELLLKRKAELGRG